MASIRPLTAEELEAHPEFPYVDWDLEPSRKEKVAVAAGRGGPFNMAYEIHGSGPIHLVWIMGLGGKKGAWQRQTRDFGHSEGSKYSCLILDNRGIGESDKPLMRYSSSEMAKDVMEIVDHVGWTNARELHIIGISMGGMIAQELALLIPNRVASLSLVSTAAALKNTTGFVENLYNRATLFIPRHIDVTLANLKHNVFTEQFLALPDELEYTKSPFPTNGDRCAAGELKKRLNADQFPRANFILQAIAAGWHHKSHAQLADLARRVGPARIMVVHGTADRMISFPHATDLLEGLRSEEDVGAGKSAVEEHLIEGRGHVLPIEMRKEFNGWVKALVERAEAAR